jgi:hypothetical protein
MPEVWHNPTGTHETYVQFSIPLWDSSFIFIGIGLGDFWHFWQPKDLSEQVCD